MAINFPNSPSNGATHTAAGQTFTYDGTAGVWNPPAASGTAARTVVYANIAALPTSGTAGDMAYVTATNRLYIWTGTGWYNIALINTNPSISGVSATYDLAIDGTVTTVTITASDPEGLPITYSIVSDTSGNTATVTQGTGANTNVFTITPSTNAAHAGTFSLTFRASDGVNIASSAASFTLQFKVVNSHYTSALITSVGANNAVNNSFDDKSTSDHTITVNGDAHQTTFSPYRHGGYSIYCDGANVMDLGFSTLNSGNWTFECWALVETGEAILGKYGGGNQLEAFGVSGTTGYMYTHTNVGIETPTCNTDLRDGKWHYLVWERYNGTYYYWADGSLETSFSNSETPGATGNWVLGGVASSRFKGKIKEARFSLSTAVYSGSAPTTPTEPQTTSNATDAFFTGVGLEIKDYSSNNRSFTVPSAFATAPTSPYDYATYSATDNGGSMYFDGTGDSIQITGGSDFTFTGDFTAECWVYCNAHTNDYAGILGFSHDSQSTGWNVLGRSNGKLHFNVGMTYTDTTGSLPLNQWVHLALVRNGSSSGNCKLYINGVADATTVTKTGTVTQPTFIQIGQYPGIAARAFNGNIADVRVVNGTAVYTSNFTPTTAPLTAVTNTKLLVQSTDAGIIDKAQSAGFVKLLGNTKSSTTQTKFLSSSMYFDGTGDYIEADDQDIGNFGTGDFTAEGWFYLTASPSNYITVAETRGSGASTTGWVMAISAGDFYVYSGAFIGAKGSAISSNTWYHWAFTRSGTDQKVFLNGTQTGSTYTTARNYTDNNFTIGAKHDASEFFTGYQSDVRITKGLARYTANFTPPTAALQG